MKPSALKTLAALCALLAWTHAQATACCGASETAKEPQAVEAAEDHACCPGKAGADASPRTDCPEASADDCGGVAALCAAAHEPALGSAAELRHSGSHSGWHHGAPVAAAIAATDAYGAEAVGPPELSDPLPLPDSPRYLSLRRLLI